MSQSGTYGAGSGSGSVTSLTAGTGITLTPNPITDTGTIALTIPVTIADGGTNATSMTNTDGVVYFDGTRLVTTAVGAATYVLTSNGSGMAPTFQVSPGSVGIATIDGDDGSVTGSTVTIKAGIATQNSGSSVGFFGIGTTLTLDVTDVNNNTIIGSGSGNDTLTGTYNVGLGVQTLTDITSGNHNIALGIGAGASITSGGANIALSTSSLGNSAGITGLWNIGIGLNTLQNITSGSSNIAIGKDAGTAYTSSETNNIILGPSAGTVATSNQMFLGDFTNTATTYIAGIAGVSIGSPHYVTIDASTGQLGATSGGTADITITGDSGGALTSSSFTFTGGATGLTFSGASTTETLTGTLVVAHGGTGIATTTAYAPIVAGTTATGAFQQATTGFSTSGHVLTSTGSSSLPTWQAQSVGIVTMDGDTGSVTGSTISLEGNATAGSSVSFSGSGTAMTFNTTDANNNVLVGLDAGNISLSGSSNAGLGYGALNSLAAGSGNVAIGYEAGNAVNNGNGNTIVGAEAALLISSGSSNIAIGAESLGNLTTGQGNTAIGYRAGQGYTGAEEHNIILGPSQGTGGASGELWIGDFNNGSTTYIAGVAEVSVSNLNYVTIDTATGQLGSTVGGSGGGTPNSFNAALTSNQTITAGTTTTLVFQTLNFINGPANYDTSTGVYTVPSTGTWRINCSINLQTAGPTLTDTIVLVHNSSNYAYVLANQPVSMNPTIAIIDIEMVLAQNDTIKLEYVSTGATNVSILGSTAPYHTWFEAVQLISSTMTTGARDVARYVVAPVAGQAGYTSIQTAIDQAVTDGASSTTPATVWIWPGQYTEDLTLAPYVNLASAAASLVFIDDGSSATIIGNAVFTGAGSISITNIGFITSNSSAAISFQSTTGALASLTDVSIAATTLGGIGIECTGSDQIVFMFGGAVVAGSGAQTINVTNGTLELFNTFTSYNDTAATIATGTLVLQGCNCTDAYTLTSGATIDVKSSNIDTNGNSFPCISIASGCQANVDSCTLNSYNTYIISGSGSLSYNNVRTLVTGVGTIGTIENTLSIISANTLMGNISFDGGATTLSGNGQIWIGGGAAPTPATLTAGAGISITNGSNSITIASTGSTSVSVVGTGNVGAGPSAIGYAFPYCNAGDQQATPALAGFPMPSNGTLSNLYVNCISNMSTGNIPITLFVNGSSTAATITVTALTTGIFSNTVDSVSVSAGDLICWEIGQSTTSGAGMIISMNVST